MTIIIFVYSTMSLLPSYYLLFTLTCIHLLLTSASDEIALRAFRSQITKDPLGVFNSWNNSHHFCKWEGITCGHKHKRRVTFLDLSSRNLYGTLSPYIGNLSFLNGLILYNNSFQSQIPSELGHLFRLEYLHVHNNSFVGQIPANLSHCTRLKSITLAYNNLVGRIPPSFASLHNLRVLDLYSNSLSGGIPSFLSNLTFLEALELGENPLRGNIPESLGQLTMLKVFELEFNELSGTIPLSIFNLTLLFVFNVAANNLVGSLPPNLGSLLPNLQVLQLSQNSFTGTIPISLSNCSRLEIFEIVTNNFEGKLAVDFGGMGDLYKLGFGGNDLGSGEADEMHFMDSLVNCTNLKFLDLNHNRFKSMLPQSIANFSNGFQEILMGGNQLQGSIPSGLGYLVNLRRLNLFSNQFTGPIPGEFGNLYSLRVLQLRDNKLTGVIPSSLGNLSFLLVLRLDNNKLSGLIPSSFGNLKQLTMLNLSQNNLNGTIPPQLFDITSLSIALDLSYNHLVGSIPHDVGNLKALTSFNVSNNNLSGEIPDNVGECISLEYLYMQDNMFLGSIPKSFDSLKGIREVDLSYNNLSGEIPKSLENLHLEKLNLSFNHFGGQVPTKGVFANSSRISILGNSNKLCGGIVELHLSRCLSATAKKHKTSLTFKILISVAAALLCVTILSLAIFFWMKRRRSEQISGSMWRNTLPKISYKMLLKATNGFSPTHLLGRGSFSSVYKGILGQDGVVVAIKVLNLQRQGASRSFMSECKALRNIRHRNLVKVISSCSSIDFQGNDFKAIVYEFMANGSLEKWLHQAVEVEVEHQVGAMKLSMLQRLNITIDVASALDYLHNNCKDPIMHCDLKPSNILLNNDMIAHVGDFGLVKFLPEMSTSNQSSTIGVKGTVGYTAPEYGLGSEVSVKGDMYSFGILVLEILTGKQPTDHMFEGDMNLHNYAKTAFPDHVMDIVDPELLNDDQRMRQPSYDKRKECLISMVRIGVSCSLESPQDRMNIFQVVNELQKVKNNFLLQPALQTRHTTM